MSNRPQSARLNHVSIPARDLEESEAFYREVLGCERIQAPNFGFPVCWMRLGDLQLHLQQVGPSAGVRTYQHFAVEVADFVGAYRALRAKGAFEEGTRYADLWLLPSGFIFLAGSVLAPVIVRRYEPHQVLTCGFLITACGYGVLTQLSATGDLWILVTGFVLFCAGLAPMGTLTTDLVMSDVPPERAGAASGISETSFEFGAALGVAVLGSIISAVYRVHMSSDALSHIAPDIVERARETLGAAIEVAQPLAADARTTIETTARDAFARAVRVASFVSAILGITAALVCVVFMKKRAVDASAQAR